jgi:tRNA-specific 2-thiouridylase
MTALKPAQPRPPKPSFVKDPLTFVQSPDLKTGQVNPPKVVVVGLSGGVDSAVAAARLKQQGHRVIGIFMKNWEDDDDSEYCSSRQDFLDAAAVADRLGIELQAVNFAADYKDRVFAEFLREYEAGRTPNPDVLCNAEIKFKAFLDHAFQQGADFIATGHYARVRRNLEGRVELLRGLDETKDQSYFLYRLRQDQLDRVLFPVGELRKTEVRAIAESLGLPNAKKKDSTGICFIGERPFREFLSRYLKTQPGPICTPDGIQVGGHQGLSFFTLGQRKGLGIGGVRKAVSKRSTNRSPLVSEEGKGWFVVKKDLETNTLYVSQDHDHPWLMSGWLTTIDGCWVSGEAPLTPLKPSPNPDDGNGAGDFGVKTRYRQADASARLAPITGETGTRGDSDALRSSEATESQTKVRGFTLHFQQAQWAVTPGQSAVVYDGEVCLGGGIIAQARP